MSPLSEPDVASRLTALPAWQVEKGELTRTFVFKDFLASLAFVNQVAGLAEKAGHHPERVPPSFCESFQRGTRCSLLRGLTCTFSVDIVVNMSLCSTPATCCACCCVTRRTVG